MTERGSENAIRSYHFRPEVTKRFKRFLLVCYCLLVRLLLKTDKTELSPGVVILPESILNEIDWGNPRNRSFNQTSNTSRLLTVSQLNQIPVEEAEIDSSQPRLRTPRTQQLFQAIGSTIQFWWNRVMFPLAPADDTSTTSTRSPIWKWTSLSGLAGAAALLLFTNLDYPLFEPDEARNAQIAMNIIESNQWLTLTLADEHYWDKPPLQHWCIAGCYKLFGVNPLATRLPGVLASCLTLLFTVAFGWKIVGYRSAWLGGTMLLLSVGFVLIGRYVTMDANLACWVTLLTLSMFVATNQQLPRRWLTVAGVAAGFGLLTKGPIVLVLGLPPVLMAAWLNGDRLFTHPRRWAWLLVPMTLIAAPWYLATAIATPEFVPYFFWKHHVVRFSDAFNHRAPFWYYLPALLIVTFPASYLFPSLMKFAFSRNKPDRQLRSRNHGFLLLYVLWVLGFFSISSSKLSTYILPCLPPLCLLTGVLLDKKIFARWRSGWQAGEIYLERVPRYKAIEIGLITIGMVSIAGFVLGRAFIPVWIVIIGALILIGLTILILKSSTSPTRSWVCLGVVGFAAVFVSNNQMTPAIARYRSTHLAARELKLASNLPDMPVIFFDQEDYGIDMILPKLDSVHYDMESLEGIYDYLWFHRDAVLITDEEKVETLRRVLGHVILFQEQESARDLYLCRPNPSYLARIPDPTSAPSKKR